MLTTKPRFLTIVELISRAIEWDDCQQCPTRDYMNLEIVSDHLLTKAEIDEWVSCHPGFMIGGISEIDYNTTTEEF